MTAEAADPSPGTESPEPREGRVKPGMIVAFLRFGLVGSVGVLVNLGVLQVLHVELGWGFTRSSAIATETAILTNYLGNELFTFHMRRLSLRRLVQYNAAALVSLGVTVAVATVAKELVHPLLAQLIGIGLGSGLNFLANFGWIWRR